MTEPNLSNTGPKVIDAEWEQRVADAAQFRPFGPMNVEQHDAVWARLGKTEADTPTDIVDAVKAAEREAALYGTPFAQAVFLRDPSLSAEDIAYWRPILVAQGYGGAD